MEWLKSLKIVIPWPLPRYPEKILVKRLDTVVKPTSVRTLKKGCVMP
ncbi:hypothetical protein [Rickettsia endosymbiont of Orchestes rusci]